ARQVGERGQGGRRDSVARIVDVVANDDGAGHGRRRQQQRKGEAPGHHARAHASTGGSPRRVRPALYRRCRYAFGQAWPSVVPQMSSYSSATAKPASTSVVRTSAKSSSPREIAR